MVARNVVSSEDHPSTTKLIILGILTIIVVENQEKRHRKGRNVLGRVTPRDTRFSINAHVIPHPPSWSLVGL